jgi:hypothetical protein
MRAGGKRDFHAALEVGQASRIAQLEASSADRVQSVRPHVVEPEPVSERKGLFCGSEPVSVLPCDGLHPRQTGQQACSRVGLLASEELSRTVQLLEGPVALAAVPPELREEHVDFPCALGTARRDQFP